MGGAYKFRIACVAAQWGIWNQGESAYAIQIDYATNHVIFAGINSAPTLANGEWSVEMDTDNNKLIFHAKYGDTAYTAELALSS